MTHRRAVGKRGPVPAPSSSTVSSREASVDTVTLLESARQFAASHFTSHYSLATDLTTVPNTISRWRLGFLARSTRFQSAQGARRPPSPSARSTSRRVARPGSRRALLGLGRHRKSRGEIRSKRLSQEGGMTPPRACRRDAEPAKILPTMCGATSRPCGGAGASKRPRRAGGWDEDILSYMSSQMSSLNTYPVHPLTLPS